MTEDDIKKREELLDKIDKWVRAIIDDFDGNETLDLAKARKELIDYLDSWIKE